jgi:catechol 2,3-dioxygenase-like lactoylglutathione lyase family enzyme
MPVAPPTTVNVRYMVHDVDAAIAWYTKHLGFHFLSNYAPAFADVNTWVAAAIAKRTDQLSRAADA